MEVRPLSARSVVLSLLLGAHPPELSARDLVAVGEHFGIAEATLRVALTRMVANGDLERADGTYRLSARMLERQQRQDRALDPGTRPWDGAWETVVVTSGGRSAGDRADLRATLTELRLAELREGVWLRPANLERPLPTWPADLISTFRAVPDEDDAALAGRLFALTAWDERADALLHAVEVAASGAERIAVAATMVRHLRTDPALPDALLPRGWSGPALREAYAAYQRELVETGIALRVSASA
jgi:phenylacetic acid degradation operon negative regulatory protein